MSSGFCGSSPRIRDQMLCLKSIDLGFGFFG